MHGSGELAQTLIEHDLIDEYRLLYFPVHLGTGKKLFRDGARAAALRLVSTSATGTGVIIASYTRPAPRGTAPTRCPASPEQARPHPARATLARRSQGSAEVRPDQAERRVKRGRELTTSHIRVRSETGTDW